MSNVTQISKSHELCEKKKFIINLSIQKAWDAQKSMYLPGGSDEDIATEHGVQPCAVKKIREEVFGSIKSDTEIDDLRNELSSLRHLCGDFEKKINKLAKIRGYAA